MYTPRHNNKKEWTTAMIRERRQKMNKWEFDFFSSLEYHPTQSTCVLDNELLKSFPILKFDYENEILQSGIKHLNSDYTGNYFPKVYVINYVKLLTTSRSYYSSSNNTVICPNCNKNIFSHDISLINHIIEKFEIIDSTNTTDHFVLCFYNDHGTRYFSGSITQITVPQSVKETLILIKYNLYYYKIL